MGGAIAVPEVSTAEDQYLIDAIQTYIDLVKALFSELSAEDEEDTEMKGILCDEAQLGSYLQKVENTIQTPMSFKDFCFNLHFYTLFDHRCLTMVDSIRRESLSC